MPKKCFFFFKVRAEKGIVWHIDTSSMVWSLTDNGKFTNQIVRLVAIVVKIVLMTINIRNVGNTKLDQG